MGLETCTHARQKKHHKVMTPEKKGKGQREKLNKNKRRERDINLDLNNTECFHGARLRTGKRGEVKMRERSQLVWTQCYVSVPVNQSAADQHFPRCVTIAQSDMGLVSNNQLHSGSSSKLIK